MTRDEAIQWIHEIVGHRLDGDAPLVACIAVARAVCQKRINSSPAETLRTQALIELHELNFHVLPALQETANGK